MAPGTVFAAIVFLLFAAVRSHSGEAKRIDATLRRLASAPVGPWLLAVVAIETGHVRRLFLRGSALASALTVAQAHQPGRRCAGLAFPGGNEFAGGVE